jgi:uncharacterized alpha-E superfamily protein
MSRYIERAETTARLLDVNIQLLLDFEGLDDSSLQNHWKAILASFGYLASYQLTYSDFSYQSIIRHLTLDVTNPLSICSSISQARENARMVRDQISSEMWETLNEAYHLIRAAEAQIDTRDPFPVLAIIKEKSLLFQGITEAAFAHGPGYKFIQIGKFLERADQTSRMVDIQHPSFGPSDDNRSNALQLAQWIAVLRTCSAFEAYHHRYLDQIQPAYLAEFLLLSPTFPRSVRHCVSTLDYHMRGLTFTREGQYSNSAEQIGGRLRAEIGYTTIDEVIAHGMHDYIDQLQVRLIDLNNALLQCYVHQPLLQASPAPAQSQIQQQQ